MSGNLSTIWRMMAGQRGRYLSSILAMGVASFFLYLAPVVPQIVLDGVIVGGGEEATPFVARGVEALGGQAWLASNLWWPALLFLLVSAAAGAFTYLKDRWSAQACESIVQRVRDLAYDHLQRLRCRYFDQAETGDLVQRCTSDVETLRTFLSTQITEIGRTVIMLLAPIPIMLLIDWRMTVASLVCVPLLVGFSTVFFLKVRSAFGRADAAEGALTATLQENLSGIRVVRAFARQDFEEAKFAKVCGTHRDLDYRLYVLMAWYWATSDFLCFLQKGLVVATGVYLMATGALQVGAFFYFLTVVTLFIWPVRMMGRILTDLGKALVAIGRLREILDEPREDAETSADSAGAPVSRGAIVFEKVGFSHDGRAPVLEDVSFEIPAGGSLALLGPSGCGKSTLVNLLLRLYDYDSGSIRLDGRELRDLDRHFVRSRMAVVMQEPFLYSKTLRENIRLARPGATDADIFEAANDASVHETILDLGDGYDTLVGERGVTLSGGQRQRVALARALLQGPPILILDDALSAVDNDTERLILEALRKRKGRQTTLLIAHRLSTVMHADRVVVLDRGRVVQAGTHPELLAQDGMYRKLWQAQSAIEGELRAELDTPGRKTS